MMAQATSSGRLSLARLAGLDLAIVHGCCRSARCRPARSCAIALSWLGNGWIYLVLPLLCVAGAGLAALPVLAIGAANAGLLHCLYPAIKRGIARPRPFQRDTRLVPLLAVLDEHSFPSGHAMTLTASLVPIVLAFPAMLGAAVVVWLLMAWARLASAHHYPSDVLIGAALGLSVAWPLSVYALALSRVLL